MLNLRSPFSDIQRQSYTTIFKNQLPPQKHADTILPFDFLKKIEDATKKLTNDNRPGI